MKNKKIKASRRNKTYRPGRFAPQLGLLAFNDCLARGTERVLADVPIIEEDAAEASTMYWLCLGRVKDGTSSRDDWAYLVTGMNIGLMLCERGIGKEYEQHMVDALEAITRARLRGDQRGSYLLDGPGIAAVTEALEVHDVQCEHATMGDMLAAKRMIGERIAAGQAYFEAQI